MSNPSNRRRMTDSSLATVFALAMFWSTPAHGQVPTLVPDRTLGCESCGGALQFGNIWEVALSPRGDMLVVDRDAPMLREFDAQGRPHWSGGRQGAGPGEYQLVLRAGFLPDGALAVVDMTGRRITTLGPDRKVARTTPLTIFATTAGLAGNGDAVLVAETPRGTLQGLQWRDGELRALSLPTPTSAGDPTAAASARLASNSSVARSASGVTALLAHNERYEILRFDSTGAALPPIARSIERVRRTPAEVQALRERIARNGRIMASMEGARQKAPAKSTSASSTPILPSELTLKPHVAVDGLRYDDSGRLWVRTMRGDDAHTIFDVFSPAGALLGSVTIAQQVQAFAFGGRWMITAFEDEDGVPKVRRWVVR